MQDGAQAVASECGGTTAQMGGIDGASRGSFSQETAVGRKRKVLSDPFDIPSGLLLKRGPGSAVHPRSGNRTMTFR